MTPLHAAARALALSQSGEDCFDALEAEAQEALVENVRAVLRAMWQPIETAPKDGTKVLLRVRNRTVNGWQDDVTVGWWSTFPEMWVHGASEGPTEWMIVPPFSDMLDTLLTE